MPAANNPLALEEGDALGGRYQLLERLGDGERKEVFRAHDLRLARDVAAAVLPPGPAAVQHARATEQEARVAGRLREHPNLLPVYDMGMHNGRPFLITQLMEGGSLKEKCGGDPISSEVALQWAGDLCEALGHCHRSGVLHRNVTPDNIWLDGNNTAHLGDFDVALELDAESPGASSLLVTDLPYAPPESALGGKVSVASDLYSLGVVLYEAVVGHLPFEEADPSALLEAHATRQAQRPSDQGIDLPPRMEDIIMRLLAKAPDDRFPSADALRIALARVAVIDETVVQELLDGDESERVEFKASLRFVYEDVPTEARPAIMRKLEKAVAKTIAAFLNTRGGRLLIGVSATNEIVGIEADFDTLSKKQDRDGWWLAFNQTVTNFLGADAAAAIDLDFVSITDRTVAVVTVLKASSEVWLRDGDAFEFYIRSGPASVPLSPPDAVAYIKRRFWSA